MRGSLDTSAQDQRFLRPRPSLPSLISHQSKGQASVSQSPLPSPSLRSTRLRTASSYSYAEDDQDEVRSNSTSLEQGQHEGERATAFASTDSASLRSLEDADSLLSSSKGKGIATGETHDPRDYLRQQLKISDARLRRRSDTAASGSSRNALNLRPQSLRVRDSSAGSSKQEASNASAVRPRTKRRYFVLSSAGKPVYASDDADSLETSGSEESLTSSLVGVMQAIISIFADQNDRIRYIDAGPLRIAFVIKQHLYYIAVSDWGEPETALRNQLDYLHWHVLSVVSLTQLQRMFNGRDNFDLRRLLQGTDAIVASLVDRMQSDFALMTNTLSPLRLNHELRHELGKIINALPSDKSFTSHVLYSVLLCRGKLVTLSRPRNQTVYPADFHLLVNTIYSTPSLVAPNNENWIPICLPRFNASGFLHALVSFITKEVGIVILSTDKEAFFEVREWKNAIAANLRNDNRLKPLHHAALHSDYSPGDLSIGGLRHFLYYHRTLVQTTAPKWDGIYEDELYRNELITLYQQIYDQIHLPIPKHGQGRQPVKLVYLQMPTECVIGYVQHHFELFVAVAPAMTREAAVNAAQCVARWVKHREADLFLVNAPSFA